MGEFRDYYEGVGRFLKKVWDNDYWDLPQELKDIYNSLDEFQHQQIKQFRQQGMTLAQALQSLPSVKANLQWKSYNKGGEFKPVDPNAQDWWKKYGG